MLLTIFTFLLGSVGGFAAAVGVLLYVLSIPPSDEDNKNSNENKNENKTEDNNKHPPAIMKDAALSVPVPRLQVELPTTESRKLLKDAVQYLINVQEGRDPQSSPRDAPSTEETSPPNCSLYQLEQTFQTLCISSKDRAKQLKGMSSLVADVGRVYASFAKDLSKLSVHARGNIRTQVSVQGTAQGSEQNQNGQNGDRESAEDTSYADEWWKALSLCLLHLSNDNEELAEEMSVDFSGQLSQLCDDQSMEEKRLTGEGNRLLSQLKDGLLKHEHLSQDRDKWRIKVAAAPPAKLSVIGTMTDESSKKLQRLSAAELLVAENMKVVTQYKAEFRLLMPRVFFGFRSSKATFFTGMKVQLMRVADGIRKCHRNHDSVTQRLKCHISATALRPQGDRGGGERGDRGERGVLMGFEPMLQASIQSSLQASGHGSLQTPVQTSMQAETAHDDTSRVLDIPSLLDMSLESTACLAASSPAVIPPLPPTFRQAVGLETCVWFNAFSGRVYRDAARSAYFHAWLLEKLTVQLNKGVRPGFIDEVKVESVAFGATPPLLFNVQWSPAVARKHKGAGKGASNGREAKVGREGKEEKDEKDGRDLGSIPEEDTPTEEPMTGDGTEDTYATGEAGGTGGGIGRGNGGNGSSGVSGEDTTVGTGGRAHPGAHRSPPASDSARPDGRSEVGSQSMDTAETGEREAPRDRDRDGAGVRDREGTQEGMREGGPFRGGEGRSDDDEDIECTADMAYRSGLKFKISTR